MGVVGGHLFFKMLRKYKDGVGSGRDGYNTNLTMLGTCSVSILRHPSKPSDWLSRCDSLVAMVDLVRRRRIM